MDFGTFIRDYKGALKLPDVFCINSEICLQRKLDLDVWWDIDK
jgi:hypothetical protein